MFDFIEKFYDGKLFPQKHSLKYKKMLKEQKVIIKEKETALIKNIPKSLKKDLFALIDAYGIFIEISAIDNFTVGFKLGSRFAVDTFDDTDDEFVENE